MSGKTTRLYYGPGAFDYLHRGVLQAAISALDALPSLDRGNQG